MRNPWDRIIATVSLASLAFLLFGTLVTSSQELNISAKAATLYEPTTKSFIYNKNANMRLPMASTTKIMTALVALENAAADELITVDERACGKEGSSLYLKPGECFTLSDLLYGLMLRSANDAAEAIAYHISGSIEGFSSLMNGKAVELGLTDSGFKNPHGLDDEGHYTTAHDLAKIAAKALENPLFKTIVSTYKKTITNTDGESRLVVNHNKLINLYKGAIGVKTGYTKRSGRSLVGAAERDGLTFVSVTINAPDDWNDHKKLFDYGYSHLERRILAAPGEYSYTLPVIGGTSLTLKVENTSTLTAVIKKGSAVKRQIQLDRYFTAPICRGACVGKVIFLQNGRILGEAELIAANDIPKGKKGLFK